jgi:hypothetical protein
MTSATDIGFTSPLFKKKKVLPWLGVRIELRCHSMICQDTKESLSKTMGIMSVQKGILSAGLAFWLENVQ